MWDWLQKQVDSVVQAWQEKRINAAFPAYESEQRDLHMALAGRRFSVAALEAEIERLMRPASTLANQNYGKPIAVLRSELPKALEEMDEPARDLELFQRNYKEELDPLYSELHELKEKRSKLQKEKTAAHERLRRAKADIQSWYDDSSHGNRGQRRRNNHGSVDFGELDRYKHERESAVRDLQRCAREIDGIKTTSEEIMQAIDQVKYARQQMFDLKERGIHPAKIKRKLAAAEYRVDALRESINTLEKRQAQFLEQARYQCGVVAVEAQIENVKRRRADFISAFDSPSAEEARRRAHRKLWLKKHEAKAS